MPSSFSTSLPYALAFSAHPPVSVCGTVGCCGAVGFFPGPVWGLCACVGDPPWHPTPTAPGPNSATVGSPRRLFAYLPSGVSAFRGLPRRLVPPPILNATTLLVGRGARSPSSSGRPKHHRFCGRGLADSDDLPAHSLASIGAPPNLGRRNEGLSPPSAAPLAGPPPEAETPGGRLHPSPSVEASGPSP